MIRIAKALRRAQNLNHSGNNARPGETHIDARFRSDVAFTELARAGLGLRRGELPELVRLVRISDGSDDLVATGQQLAHEFEADASTGPDYTPRRHRGAGEKQSDVKQKARGERGQVSSSRKRNIGEENVREKVGRKLPRRLPGSR